jgi:hypothetical protein
MREQVRRLEDAYEAALRRQREQDESPAHLLAVGLPSSSEALAHLYTRLSILRDDLRRENEELEGLVKQHARFQEHVLRYARELQQANQQQQVRPCPWHPAAGSSLLMPCAVASRQMRSGTTRWRGCSSRS